MTGNPAPQQPGERRLAGPASPADAGPVDPDQGTTAEPATPAGAAEPGTTAVAAEPAMPAGAATPAVQAVATAGPGTPAGGAAEPSAGIIEATTGAPLRDLPRRVPLRSPHHGSVPVTALPPDPGAGGPGRPAVDEPAFWLPIEEVHWDGRPIERETRSWFERRRADRMARRRTASRAKPLRDPRYGLPGMLALTLLAGFFAWVGAEPIWLAVGHGDRGVATVARCTGHGLGLHCRGEFTAASGEFTARDVRLSGVAAGKRSEGARVAAWMVGAGGAKAYAETGVARHLRWLLSLLITLLCGPAIVWATGAQRLPDPRTRRGATFAGLAGPVLLTAGFLAAAY